VARTRLVTEHDEPLTRQQTHCVQSRGSRAQAFEILFLFSEGRPMWQPPTCLPDAPCSIPYSSLPRNAHLNFAI
jgi:hypothetical protein